MLDFPLLLQEKMPVVDIIQSQNSKFATGVENEATLVTQNLMIPLQRQKSTNISASHLARCCKKLD